MAVLSRVLMSGPLFFLLMISCQEKEERQAEAENDQEPALVLTEPVLKKPEIGSGEAIPDEARSEDMPLNHERTIEKLMTLQQGFVDDLRRRVADEKTDGFLESLASRKTKLRKLLKEAKELPAPSSGEKGYYKIAQESFSDLNLSLMDAVMAKMRKFPDDHEISTIFRSLGEDEETEELKDQFDRLYR